MYSDSDHAGLINAGLTRSQTRVVILLNSMPVHWRSNKQPKTSLSSAEAEIYAMMEAVQDGVLRLRIAEDAGLEVNWPMPLSVDNAAGESFCNKTTPHSKLRGVFHMKDQRIRELRDAEIVRAQHVESERNLADRLTKGLSATARDRLDQELDQVRLSLIKLHI